jgi:hypothetical protein
VKDLFADFRPEAYEHKDAVEKIADARRNAMEEIVGGYLELLEREVENLAWLVEHETVARAYDQSVMKLRGLSYTHAEIEQFCAEMDRAPLLIMAAPGPVGLYLSALVNYCEEDTITLRLRDYRRTFHFIGYGLPRGKALTVEGDAGDFTGAGLRGGHLLIRGNAAAWLGAGMIEGSITVEGDAGRDTGAWMQGGEIIVEGALAGTGEPRYGGVIREHKGTPVPPHAQRRHTDSGS